MKYRHNVYGEVTVTTMYDTFCMAQTSAGLKACYLKDMQEVRDNVIEMSDHVPPPKPDIVLLPPPTPVEEPEPEPEAEPDKPEPEKEKEPDTRININTSSVDAIAKKMRYIGKVKGRLIKNRQEQQPNKVYTDFEHFKTVNKDLLDNEGAWAGMSEHIKFTDEAE